MQTLAIQTDSRGVSALLLETPKAGAARLIAAATVDSDDSARDLAAALRGALPGLRSGRVELAVALGPADIRARPLSAPPAPEAELPAIVALQAAREAATDPDSLVVDFLPEAGAASLLACWCEPATTAYWAEVASTLGGKLTVITPRALATLALGEGDALAVATRAGDTLDFAAGSLPRPTMLRGARAPETDNAAVAREVRRTLLTLEGPHRRLADGVTIDDAEAIDWDQLAKRLDAKPADLSGRAAAAGLALLAGADAAPPLNLADPRRPPVEETGHRRLALLATAAAAVVALGLFWAYDRLADLDRQLADKRAQIAEASEAVEAFEPYRERVETLDAWRANDVTWLDELERLGRGLRPLPLTDPEFDAAYDVRLTRINAVVATGRNASGGRIDLSALARSTATSPAERRLRDDGRKIEAKSLTDQPTDSDYPFAYEARLTLPAEIDEGAAP